MALDNANVTDVEVAGTQSLRFTSDSAFQIIAAETPGNEAVSLGPFRDSSRNDLLIYTSDPTRAPIPVDLGAANTVGDVLSAINAATGGDVVAEINDDNTGINLRELGPQGEATFRVAPFGTSAAAADLGIWKSLDTGSDPNNRTIVGDPIGGVRPSDRLFFLAENANDATVVGNFTATAAEIEAEARYGFVAVELSGEGEVTGEFQVSLIDPGVGVNNDGRIRFSELREAISNIEVTPPSVDGGMSLDINVPGFENWTDIEIPALAGVDISLSPLSVSFHNLGDLLAFENTELDFSAIIDGLRILAGALSQICLLYTSPSPRDKRQSRMPSSA